MNNSTTNTILDDDAVAEIEKRDWHLNGALEKRIALTPTERDALCQTVRALRAEIADYEQTDLVPRSRYNAVDAEAREAREHTKQLAHRAGAEIENLQSQLEQVTKERDTAREFVTRLTIEKQKLEQQLK